MRTLASILIWLSLALGAIAATTAYVPTLDAAVASSEPLTLAAPAGLDEAATEKSRAPLVPAVGADGTATRLTPEVAERLRDHGVTRVRVKEFSLARWSGAWLFLLACAGLGLGTVILRRSLRDAPSEAGVVKTSQAAVHPSASLRDAIAELTDLRAALRQASREEQLALILARVGRVQSTQFAAFIDRRGQLVGELGMAGFARLMSAFAAGERQVNRAWSAAADGALDEAVASLDAGIGALVSIGEFRDARVR